MSENFKKRILTSVTLVLLFLLILKYKFVLIFSLLVLGVYSVLEFYSISKKIIKNVIYLFVSNSIFTLYIFIFCLLFFISSNFFQTKLILIFLLLGCIASDIGGYIFGKIFKGPKLTKISPKKTITGSLGSIILSNLVICYLFFNLTNNLSSLIILGTITSFGCQLGDLFFSFLKRKAKIDDTGNILPGHGGVLDRLDGILLGLPVGFITLYLIS